MRGVARHDDEEAPEDDTGERIHSAPTREARSRAQDVRDAARFRRGPWLVIAVAAGAASVAMSVAARHAPYLPVDLALTRALQAASLGAIAGLLAALNALGFPPLVDVVYGAVIATLLLLGRRWAAAASTFDVAGSAGLNDLVKHWVNRPRPLPTLVHVEHRIPNSTYPAGHVLNFTAFVGFLGCLAYVAMPPSWRRSVVIAMLVALTVLMGVARVDSGEHWPSDVAGGYALGVFWMSVTVLFYRWGRTRFPDPWPRWLARPAFLLLPALAMLAGAHPGAARAQPAVADDSLATSRGVPWNPPGPLPRRRAWERAVLLPERIVSLPLSGLGYATRRTLTTLEHDPRFTRGISPPTDSAARLFVLHTPRLGDRAGLGGAIEARRRFAAGRLQNALAAEYAATLRRYNRTLFTWEGMPGRVQYGDEWRPQDRFYGIGNGTPKQAISDYALQREYVRGTLDWETQRGSGVLAGPSSVRLWAGPMSRVTRRGREAGEVSIEQRFAGFATTTLDRRVDQLVYGASVLHDQRRGAPHWTRGWRGMLAVERWDRPLRALALHSAEPAGAQLTRFDGEAETGYSFWRDPRSLRLYGRVSGVQVSSGRERLLPSDYSVLGGQAGLAGFGSGRFHDLDALLVRLSYVFPLERLLEMDVHSEWGEVGSDLAREASIGALHPSAGFSLRMRDDQRPRASAGLDFSREGVRIQFAVGGVR